MAPTTVAHKNYEGTELNREERQALVLLDWAVERTRWMLRLPGSQHVILLLMSFGSYVEHCFNTASDPFHPDDFETILTEGAGVPKCVDTENPRAQLLRALDSIVAFREELADVLDAKESTEDKDRWDSQMATLTAWAEHTLTERYGSDGLFPGCVCKIVNFSDYTTWCRDHAREALPAQEFERKLRNWLHVEPFSDRLRLKPQLKLALSAISAYKKHPGLFD